MMATMIYNHEWNGAEVRRNFGVLSLSFPMFRRTVDRRTFEIEDTRVSSVLSKISVFRVSPQRQIAEACGKVP